MDPAIVTAEAIVVAAIVAGLFSYVGAKFGRRKEKADAAAIVTATAISLLAPLNTDIAKLSGQVTGLQAETQRLSTAVVRLEVDNRNLRSENSGLRARVSALEAQILGLGHTPVNGNPPTPPMGTVTTSTTETVTHPIATEGDKK